jgi:fructose/tagatose bisphosphate aldolase
MVEEAVEFVAKTGIDVFAGFFGNYHGRYQRPATITWGRMRQIRRAFLRHGWPVPLALHGSSYLTTKEFNNTQIARQALKSGCYKFNHATILSDILKDNLPSQLVARMNRYAGGEKLWRKALAKYEKEIDKLDKKILDQAIAKIKEHVAVWMREAWKSSGKKKYYR